METTANKKPLRHAGGWRITDGGYDFRLVKRRTIQKWRTTIKQFLLNQSTTRADPRIQHMLDSAASEWATFEAPEYQAWASLTPLLKSQALFAWILRQQGRNAVDIIASGVAGDLYDTLKPQSRHDSYARAVSVARPIWFLLRRDWRIYEHDNGHGVITKKKVWINKNVRLRSRNACQRIEAAIRLHCDWFIKEYQAEIVKELQERGLV